MLNKNPLLLTLSCCLSLIIFSSCEYERPIILNDCGADALTIAVDETNSSLSVECGANTGSIVLQEDSNAEVLYSINNGDFLSTNTFSNLGAGTYELIAKISGTNCLSDILTLNIVNENGLQLTLVEKVDADCGTTSGLISVSQENGILPIQYKIGQGPPQDASTFDNLAPGTYNISATDANGCTTSINNISITSGVSLSQDIKSIIVTNCAVTGCHANAQSPNLSSSQAIIDNASRIKSRTSSGTMPPSGRADLTQTEIDLIACWVEDGALNN